MTTTTTSKAGILNALREAKANLAEFKADDPRRYQGFRLHAVLAGFCLVVGYVFMTRSIGWNLMLAGGVMALFAVTDVQDWRISQLRKRVEALQGPPPAPAVPAPEAAQAGSGAPAVTA